MAEIQKMPAPARGRGTSILASPDGRAQDLLGSVELLLLLLGHNCLDVVQLGNNPGQLLLRGRPLGALETGGIGAFPANRLGLAIKVVIAWVIWSTAVESLETNSAMSWGSLPIIPAMMHILMLEVCGGAAAVSLFPGSSG